MCPGRKAGVVGLTCCRGHRARFLCLRLKMVLSF